MYLEGFKQETIQQVRTIVNPEQAKEEGERFPKSVSEEGP